MLRGIRTTAVLALALGMLAAPGSSSAGPAGAVSPSGLLQTALVRQINAFRSAHGLSRLHVSRALGAAANAHSSQMARLGYFSHSSANGQSFSARVARYYPARGFRRWAAGENLVYGSPDLTAVQALQLWLSSPPHRANLLDPRWRELGLAAVHSTSAPGVYHGAPTTVVTADFGSRSR
jgi:uncharacterized protein YkwD